MDKPVRKTRPTAKRSADGYIYRGRTSDGVRIIDPELKPDHFTREEIAEAWERVFARMGRPVRAADR